MIEVHEKIEISCPPRHVWDLLSEPHKVVDCVPGASLVAEHEDGTFDGSMLVQFGPVKVTFKARVSLELDNETMTGNVNARGKDNQGGTRFIARMKFKVDEEPGGASVIIDAEVEISGKLAGVVETGAKFVVKRITSEFSERLASRCGIPAIQGRTE